MFDHLYKAESLREVGTLKYFRERVNRKNVTPDKVTKSFEGAEDFFVSVGTAYILEAAMEFFGLKEVNGTPTKHVPPAGILHLPKARKKTFNDVLGSFVDEFVMADPDQDPVTENQELQRISSLEATVGHDHDYFAASQTNGEQQDNTDDDVTEEDTSGTDKVWSVYFKRETLS